MIPAKVLYNLVVIDKMFMEVKIRNVRDFLVINNELVIFTYFEKFHNANGYLLFIIIYY